MIVASLFEIIPTFLIKSNVPTIASVKPYTPLELAGRDIYIREGCFNCHSQMIRPLRYETERYGEYSKPGEFVYDHPFLWGSRRIGPDLAREGGKYPDLWHVRHMRQPRDISPQSIMPAYPWMLTNTLDFDGIQRRVDVMAMLGVPYGDALHERPRHGARAGRFDRRRRSWPPAVPPAWPTRKSWRSSPTCSGSGATSALPAAVVRRRRAVRCASPTS